MAGIATTCKSNPETERDGCGAPYRGRQSHCVAPAPWSTHADGLCHATFGAPSTFDAHFTKEGHVDPRTVEKLHQDGAGVWKAQERSGMDRFAALRGVGAAMEQAVG